MVLKLEGRLADAWVDDLADAAHAVSAGAERVTFDLDGLTFVDARGVALLRGASERGARLTGGSAFITALMQQDRHA
jgi:anti-anti-sigma regulatory factor